MGLETHILLLEPPRGAHIPTGRPTHSYSRAHGGKHLRASLGLGRRQLSLPPTAPRSSRAPADDDTGAAGAQEKSDVTEYPPLDGSKLTLPPVL